MMSGFIKIIFMKVSWGKRDTAETAYKCGNVLAVILNS